MKKIGLGLISLLISLSLISCSSNTSKQDVGMVTGAVAGGLIGSTIGSGAGKLVAVGAGAIVGALIGGAIGKSMDQTDQMKMNQALNKNPGQSTHWVNKKTGTSYTVMPTKNVTVAGNQNCRKYYTIVTMNGKKQRVYGTACLQNGTWQAV